MQHPHPKLFNLSDKKSKDLPVYMLRDGHLYRTAFHPRGWSEHPQYCLERDGKFYRTQFHEKGFSSEPAYRFGKDQMIYRVAPGNQTDRPIYQLKD
ncbi:MAG: hypothetical protein HUK40_19725 [Desulfobacter sp.]|nr:hypothetical protein [Desulfobacter sp.]WDP86542.1 MAG: hypothetical protein HUN05_16610 [Desulfobacter sp.]